jgi:hypothetical protein
MWLRERGHKDALGVPTSLVEPPDVAAQGVLVPDSKNMFSKNFPKPTLSQTATREKESWQQWQDHRSSSLGIRIRTDLKLLAKDMDLHLADASWSGSTCSTFYFNYKNDAVNVPYRKFLSRELEKELKGFFLRYVSPKWFEAVLAGHHIFIGTVHIPESASKHFPYKFMSMEVHRQIWFVDCLQTRKTWFSYIYIALWRQAARYNSGGFLVMSVPTRK